MQDYAVCNIMPSYYYIRLLCLKKLAPTQRISWSLLTLSFPLQKNRAKSTTGYLLFFPNDFMLCNCKGDQTVLLRALSARKQLSSVFPVKILKCNYSRTKMLQKLCCFFFFPMTFFASLSHDTLWCLKSSFLLVLITEKYHEGFPQL